jgi:pimeloyl-ACP methyl ester carboxylesterase
MAYAVNGETKLYYEETGDGVPVIFVHEFGGDHRSWEPQVGYLSRFYRCVSFNARGYPPSDVPADASAYSQDISIDDFRAVLDGLGVERAHLVGLSMGSSTVLGFTLRHPHRARSMVVCGCGYGSVPEQREDWLRANAEMADALMRDPAGTAEAYARGPTRMPFKIKDPRGWADFEAGLKALDPMGASLTLKGVQPSRPRVFELEAELAALDVPALIVAGDEDDPALEPALFLKRRIPRAGLWVIPRTGHAVNTEEPDFFNRALLDFFTAVDNQRWPARDLG